LGKPGLPDRVAAFIAAHIRTIDDLHLLVAMAAASERWWDAASAAGALTLDVKAARAVLEHLAAHNLLEIRVMGDVRYQFRPGTPELRAAAATCIEAYRAEPAAVWRAVSASPARRSLRDFADAFRIRRDDGR
jgi:hypothetical protein